MRQNYLFFRMLICLTLLLCIGGITLAAGLSGSKHDFTRDDPDNPFRGTTKGCTPCHRFVNSPPRATINGEPVEVKASRVCLACHSKSCERFEEKVERKFARDFTFQHPVDVPMPTNSTEFIPISAAKAKGIIFYGEQNLIGCTSCHDTHNAKGYAFFLRDEMDQGQLCCCCHNK